MARCARKGVNMKLAHLFAILMIGVVLFGCAQQRVYQDGANDNANPQSAPVPDSAAPIGGKTGPDVAETKRLTEPNPAIVKLLARNGQVKSYSFDVALLPDKRGGSSFAVKGDNVLVTPLNEQTIQTGADAIFLDLVARTATGYCVRGEGRCDDPNAPIAMDFNEWSVPLPPSYLDDIQYGEIIGSLTYFNKPVTRIKYQRGALYYEAYIDNYFGYPQRVAIASDAEMTNIIGGYEYRNMAFNSVRDNQVVHVDVKL